MNVRGPISNSAHPSRRQRKDVRKGWDFFEGGGDIENLGRNFYLFFFFGGIGFELRGVRQVL
jgi:hypothetical protein